MEGNEEKVPITKLSSAGLIFKHFGKEVIANTCLSEYDISLSDSDLNHVYQKIYSGLILEIDAIDNGVNICDNPVYSISTNLSKRIALLN